MSWQDYVDNQLIASQCVSKACIAGHDGGVWAKSDGFEVSFLSKLRILEFSWKILFSSSCVSPQSFIILFTLKTNSIFLLFQHLEPM
jgi:hypothetical protein